MEQKSWVILATTCSKMSEKKFRGWVFTINNYTDSDVEGVKNLECKAIKAGFEVGENGTPHIQGAVYFKSARHLGGVKKLLPRSHLEPMRGNWDQQDYCLKDGSILRKEGDVQQGKRADLEAFRDAVKRKAPDGELFEDHLNCVAKYPRLELRLKQSFARDESREFRDVDVIVHWGEAGTGKTRTPYEAGAYMFSDYEHGWWDDYQGEEIICIDEFYGGIKYSQLLRLLDGYQCRLKIKGGFTYARWTKVYITSNKEPKEWYAVGLTDALKRRITKVIHFDQLK